MSNFCCLCIREKTTEIESKQITPCEEREREREREESAFYTYFRLNTVLDYDRILVLDRGTIAEFDSPKELIAQKGAFYRMLEDSNTQ